MAIVIFLVILFCCLKKPMLGLALILQTNIIRALISIDYDNPCFNCINESDLLLGAIAPLLGMMIILLRLEVLKQVKYVFDKFDGLFIAILGTLFFTSLYAINMLESITYTLRFLFLGFSYFFLTKIMMINSRNHLEDFKMFLLYSLWISIILGTFGGILYMLKGFGAPGVYRMTIPGVHPIPFSQLLGLGIFVSFVIFITNGSFFGIKSKTQLNFNKIILPYLVLLLLATNTRGIMVSVAAAILLYMFLAKVKIKKRILYISGAVMVLAVIFAVQFIDFEVLFQRLLAKQTAKSVDERLIAYTDSVSIFFKHPFGIGPDAFQHYSTLPYPHNIFLEFLSQYGIFGLLISLYFILTIVYMFLLTLKKRITDLAYVVMFCLFIYFFIETNFSFTLWMHKGMFIFMGLFAGYSYRIRKDIGKINI